MQHVRQPPQAHSGLTVWTVCHVLAKDGAEPLSPAVPSCSVPHWSHASLLHRDFWKVTSPYAKKLQTMIHISCLLKIKGATWDPRDGRGSWDVYPGKLTELACQLFNYYDTQVCNVLGFIALLTTNDASQSLICRKSKGGKWRQTLGFSLCSWFHFVESLLWLFLSY